MTYGNVLDRATQARYLERIGFDGVPSPTIDTLRALHRQHLEHVPFENLDLHAGRRIELDVNRFVAKIVDERRGGFCYELNGAFAALLRSIGFDVDLLEAHVHDDRSQARPYDHLCLKIGGTDPHLADVGFGDCFDEPIPFVVGRDHVDAAGTFRLDQIDGGAIDLVRGSEPQYRFDLAAHSLADFAPGCEFHQSPESHFTKGTVCSRRTPDGRVTLRGLTLIRTHGGSRTETDIDEDQLTDTLRHEFGIVLPHDLATHLVTTIRRQAATPSGGPQPDESGEPSSP